MLKKMMALLLCAMMLVSLVACGDKPDDNTPDTPAGPKEDVIVGMAMEFVTTDPQASNSVAPLMLFKMTHETLTELDASGNVIPGMATYEQPDALTYIFTIPDNVTFTNGDPCTTEDIAYTFERAKESSYTSSKLTTLESVEILSPTQIQFKLNKVNQDFLTNLAYKTFSILSKKACEADPAKGFEIGTGRYYVTQWVPGEVTAVARYDGYRGEKGVAKTVTFRHIAETSARIIALQNNEIDIALGLESLDASTIEADSNLELVKFEDVAIKYLALNMSAAPFDNQKVRQAIAHAVNKDNVILGALNGEGSVQTAVMSKPLFGHNSNLEQYAYDPALAKQMLADAGYPNGLEITLSCYKGAPYETIAAVLQNDMAAAGITVKINPVESAALKAMMKAGEHEIAIYGWADASSPDYTLRTLLYSTSGSNRSLIKDPALDKMIDDALSETDVAKREQMYKDIQVYVQEVCPYVMLYTSYVYSGVSKGTTGVVWDPTNMHNFCYVSVPAE